MNRIVGSKSVSKKLRDSFSILGLHSSPPKVTHALSKHSLSDRKTSIKALHCEILHYIFLVLQDIDGYEFHMLLQPYTPIIMSQVCRSWRLAAVSNNSLWTNIRITFPWNLDLVRLFLTRSFPRPIEFELIIHLRAWQQHPETWFRDGSHQVFLLYGLLASHLPRFRRLLIQAKRSQAATFLGHYFRSFSGPLPLLEELVIENYDNLDRTFLTPLPIFPGGLPALRIVKLGVCAPLPSYSRLTSFHLCARFVTFRQFYHILTQCDVLETLALYENFHIGNVVDDDTWSFQATDDLRPLTLPFLSSLQLYYQNSFLINRLLLLISTSRLHELVINPYFWANLSYFRRYSTGSCPNNHHNLTHLALASESYSTAVQDRLGIRTAAQCFPNVQELTYAGSWRVPAVLEELATGTDEEGRMLFPNLSSIAFDCPVPLPLLDLFQAREVKGAPLLKVYLSQAAANAQPQPLFGRVADRWQVEVRSIWQELRKGGLFYPYRTYGCVIPE